MALHLPTRFAEFGTNIKELVIFSQYFCTKFSKTGKLYIINDLFDENLDVLDLIFNF